MWLSFYAEKIDSDCLHKSHLQQLYLPKAYDNVITRSFAHPRWCFWLIPFPLSMTQTKRENFFRMNHKVASHVIVLKYRSEKWKGYNGAITPLLSVPSCCCVSFAAHNENCFLPSYHWCALEIIYCHYIYIEWRNFLFHYSP